jgi:hypothetical protein
MDKAKQIQLFNAQCIHNRIDPYFAEDIDCFYNDSNEFSLNLKRSSHGLALYGVQHVALRQGFFNQLPQDQRVAMLVSKLQAKGIFQWVLSELDSQPEALVDALDIGKGRSIYKLITNNDAVVVKEKPNNAQHLFNQIAAACDRPYPKSQFKQVGSRHWELSECLDEAPGGDNGALLGMHAKAAAFGDFIELGDRHFENYMLKDSSLIAIDVAHLMEPDNHHWTKAYISGGLYECCVLQHFASDANTFSSALQLFFNEYEKEARHLFDEKQCQGNEDVLAIIEKWGGCDGFLDHMRGMTCDALRVMFERLPYKQLLNQLVQSGLCLEGHQELKMYYLADEKRMSTFFRSEELGVDIFETIRELAFKKLGITQQFFVDYQRMGAQLNEILMALPQQRSASNCPVSSH